MSKFYYLEDMTQEDLNNLALERNTLQQENKQLKEVIEEIREYVENNVPITHYSFNGILEILDKVKEVK